MQNPSLPNPETNQKGYTIIELGIALTIIAVLIVAGLAGVNTVLTNSRANSQIEESGVVLAKLQSMLTSTSVSGMNTAGAVGSSYFPASRVSGSTVTNRFNGNEFVASNSAELTSTANGVAAAANVGAIYTITGVPKAVCANIASSLATLANAAWIHTTATAEGTAGAVGGFTASTSQIKAPGGQVLGAKVGTQCNAADTVNLAFFLRP